MQTHIRAIHSNKTWYTLLYQYCCSVHVYTSTSVVYMYMPLHGYTVSMQA